MRPVPWPPERVAVLSRRYPAGDPVDDIVRELNRLQGPRLVNSRIFKKAGALGLHRPAHAAPEPPPPPPGPTPEPVELAASGAILVDLAQASAWAAAHDLPFKDWDDLPLVNRKREDRRMLLFARRFPRKGVRG